MDPKVLARQIQARQILGVTSSATLPELKRAHRKLAREYHPDRNSAPDSEAKMKAVNAAYDVLVTALIEKSPIPTPPSHTGTPRTFWADLLDEAIYAYEVKITDLALLRLRKSIALRDLQAKGQLDSDSYLQTLKEYNQILEELHNHRLIREQLRQSSS